ncbi:hypothetical protein B1T47_05740, partial [Mycobacterium kansasii]
NTGVANSGDVNTGAFISGSYSNGLFWRGDHQGLIGISYGITIPAVPAHIDGRIPVAIPMTMSSSDTIFHAVTIPQFPASFLGVALHSQPVTIPAFTITGPAATAILGGPIDALVIHTAGGIGPARLSFIDIPAAPGFGNSTSSPSSGFFNSGMGSVSGFGNFGVNSSGWVNFGSGSSGVQNVGALQ